MTTTMMCKGNESIETTCVGCGAPIAAGQGDEVPGTTMLAHAGCMTTYGLDQLGLGEWTSLEALSNAVVALAELRHDDDNLTSHQRRLVRRSGVMVGHAIAMQQDSMALVAGA